MGSLLFFLLLVIILVPVFKIGFQVWRSVHGLKKEFSRQYGQYRQADTSHQQQSSATPHGHRHGKKAIDPSVGEYVEFEEIAGERTVEVDEPDSTPSDPIITDAEFEDVK